ncbi:hypothetical protein DWF00_01315 [Bosea caraganae]|uniref:Extensin-like C-terminal domain-containing protein n=1 Tax=Bosea caraganae TaxID=2763117 RepID=A0A370L9C1_9HYPH|nr:hypothetical protein DWE98_08335 [Bosea caraganae]RDJ30732.1 hypothetical protein DWF00_01315 [Bosea caraganae]
MPPVRPPEFARPQLPAAPPPAPERGHQIVVEPSSETANPAGSACLRALASVPGNRVRPAEPKSVSSADPACQITDAVTVEALAVRKADGPGEVAFNPPVTIGCDMARTLADWLDGSLEPLVRGHFGKELSRLRVGGGYECRRRNRQSAGPVSEHATGRALDIFAFTVGEPKAGGFDVVVEKHDGLAQGRFVQAVRHSACGAFSTSLGPGSDAAHANHLHVDIQARRSASTRFCQ